MCLFQGQLVLMLIANSLVWCHVSLSTVTILCNSGLSSSDMHLFNMALKVLQFRR